MNLPKFLIADNSKFPNQIFVLHTEYPRLILEVESEEIEFLEALDESEKEAEILLANLLEQAYLFFDAELEV